MNIIPGEYFTNKRILDIGCNVGFVTIQIAKLYPIESILGIDIDEKLIHKARKVIKYNSTVIDDKRDSIFFIFIFIFIFIIKVVPLSIKLTKPLPLSETESSFSSSLSSFPNNISFKREDFINDSHFGSDYDVILAYNLFIITFILFLCFYLYIVSV